MKNSEIEWTDHTFNPWWGCTKVSEACDRCYAESTSGRWGFDVWGHGAPRRFFSDPHWSEPHRWNREAEQDGVRRRVFCASMCDVFERRADVRRHRERLWDLIEATPMLDWLLLTKRPQNIGKMVPWDRHWPLNVWLGATVENQKWAEKRLPHLLRHPAAVRFLSCEPLLGSIDLDLWIQPDRQRGLYGIDWIIAGGESGRGPRPSDPDWFRSLRDQAIDADVAFHFKQWGHWAPYADGGDPRPKSLIKVGDSEMIALGKKGAGRLLDGRTWDELPVVS